VSLVLDVNGDGFNLRLAELLFAGNDTVAKVCILLNVLKLFTARRQPIIWSREE